MLTAETLSGSSSPESTPAGSFRLFEPQFRPLGPGRCLVILSLDLVALIDFFSTSVPESESDSTSSELLGFLGVFLCFFDDTEAADEAGEAAVVDGTDADRLLEDFSSFVFVASDSLAGSSFSFTIFSTGTCGET